jgi:NDP-sugar pyrophosphorylase family protein
MKDIIALILAGGDSSRMWPIKDKHSICFMGIPLIQYSIEQLARQNFQEIIAVTNPETYKLIPKIKSELPEISLKAIIQSDPRGMAGAVLTAEKHLKGKKVLIISPGDIYEDEIFIQLKENLLKNPDILIAGYIPANYFPGGYLTIENNTVLKIDEKPDSKSTANKPVSIVFDYFSKADLLISALKNETEYFKDDLFEMAINYLIRNKGEARFLHYKGYWGYLKYPWHVLEVSAHFLSKINRKISPNAQISPSAIIKGNVLVEDGARIMDNAVIIGPSYIGEDTVVGQNCLIRESMIGSKCTIGYTSEIARSYIGSGGLFHHNYIGDSVMMDKVKMGAGAVTANFRLDEKCVNSRILNKKMDTGRSKLGLMAGAGVSIGINASIMPGIKIGNHSVIGSSVLLDEDLPDNKFCWLKTGGYVIKDLKNNNS